MELSFGVYKAPAQPMGDQPVACLDGLIGRLGPANTGELPTTTSPPSLAYPGHFLSLTAPSLSPQRLAPVFSFSNPAFEVQTSSSPPRTSFWENSRGQYPGSCCSPPLFSRPHWSSHYQSFLPVFHAFYTRRTTQTPSCNCRTLH